MCAGYARRRGTRFGLDGLQGGGPILSQCRGNEGGETRRKDLVM